MEYYKIKTSFVRSCLGKVCTYFVGEMAAFLQLQIFNSFSRDKTMNDKLICIPSYDKQNYHLWIMYIKVWTLQVRNQLIKFYKSTQTIKLHSYKTLGTNLIYSPMSPLSQSLSKFDQGQAF